MSDIMLKVNDINVYYGSIHAIKDISFEVRKGQIVTLVGANGAGKSTTLQTISGLSSFKDRFDRISRQKPCGRRTPQDS